MLGLPQNTHRYLVQPLANDVHVKQVLAKRFLKFCEQLRKSSKVVVRDTFEKIKSNILTTTGRNLAELGLLLGKPASELTPSDASNIELAVIEEENKYRVDFIK